MYLNDEFISVHGPSVFTSLFCYMNSFVQPPQNPKVYEYNVHYFLHLTPINDNDDDVF